MLRVKLLKSGELSEETIHKTVMEWVRLNPVLRRIVLHFPNEGKRSLRYGKLLNDLGMRAGVSDLFIAIGRHSYNGAWIELKSKNGTVSKEQKEFLNDMKEHNYFTSVCRTIDETIRTIEWYVFSFDTKESFIEKTHQGYAA